MNGDTVMVEKQTIDAMWDDSPVDVSTEVNFIWSIANKLRGTYQSDKYKDVIIPMVIIRRFECALAPTKQKVVDQFKANPIACDGIEECRIALLKANKNLLPNNFIEGMACDGGCVQGAGCLVRSPRNRMDVEKHAKQADGRTILQAVAASQGEQPKQEAAKTEAPKSVAKPAAKAPAKPEAAPAK